MRRIIATMLLVAVSALPALATEGDTKAPATVKIHQTDLDELNKAAANVQAASLDAQRADAVKRAWELRLEVLRLRALMAAGCTNPDSGIDTETIEAAAEAAKAGTGKPAAEAPKP